MLVIVVYFILWLDAFFELRGTSVASWLVILNYLSEIL